MVKLDDPAIRAALDHEELPRMSFGDHLDELRRRLIRALLAVVVAVLAMTPFHDQVQGIVTEPYRVLWRQGFVEHVRRLEAQHQDGTLDAMGQGFLEFCRQNRDVVLAGNFRYPHLLPASTGFPLPYTLMATSGLEDIWTFFMASLIFAITLASPIVVWQAWAFIAAGLYPRERKVFYRYFPFMVGLVAAGAWFGYSTALPVSLGFLLRMMNPDQVGAMLTVGQYFTLLFGMTAAMGVVFQVPLVMVALQRVGLVRHATLTKNWRMIVLVMCIVAAVLSPPDPFSMMLMAAPMLLLYLLGLVLTAHGRKHEHPFDQVEAAR